jgi:hypothetical protein
MTVKTKTNTQANAPKSVGSAELVIKEVDVAQPARSVTRMWPNR